VCNVARIEAAFLPHRYVPRECSNTPGREDALMRPGVAALAAAAAIAGVGGALLLRPAGRAHRLAGGTTLRYRLELESTGTGPPAGARGAADAEIPSRLPVEGDLVMTPGAGGRDPLRRPARGELEVAGKRRRAAPACSARGAGWSSTPTGHGRRCRFAAGDPELFRQTTIKMIVEEAQIAPPRAEPPSAGA